MKKRIGFLGLIGFLFVGCTALNAPVADSTQGDSIITLKFVQVNDVYEIAPLSGGQYGGMARVAHIRDSIKNKYPNTYLFMAGDFLNPSLLGTIKDDTGERIRGKQMIEVMNAMEFDLVTFGNHEFDLKEEDLQKRLNESNFQWTSANARHVSEVRIEPFYSKRALKIIPVSDYTQFLAADTLGNEVKFGFFGVTIPSNPQGFVQYGDIYKEGMRAYSILKDNVDFVVGLTHLEIDQDKELAQRLKKIPLIMGGHEHNNMLIKEGETIITKADANAKTVYVHTLRFNTKSKQLALTSQLVPIDKKTASSPKIEEIVNRWNVFLESKIKEVVTNPNEIIYNAITPLDGTDSACRGVQTNLGNIVTQGMAFSFANKVDAALVNGGSMRLDDMLAGAVTSLDIFRVLPFGGEVVKVKMKGSLLQQVLDYGKAQRGTGAYLQRYNISQDTRGKWLINKNLIENTKIYTVALSDFLLKGFDIPFLTPDNKDILEVYIPVEGEVAADIRKAVILYLKSLKK